MKDKKVLAFLLLIVAIVVLVFNIFNKKEDTSIEKIKIVTNYSNFYTVNSCLQRVGGYLSTKNNDNMYLVTSEKYKKENKITKENVMDIYLNFDASFTITSKKMYYSKINDTVTKYYAYVEYRNNYDQSKISEGYFIVYLDSKKGLFSIEPYDGKIFKDGVNNA